MVTGKLMLIGGSVAALVTASLLAGLFWYRGQALSATAERDRALAAVQVAAATNATQKAAMERLTTFRAADDKLMVELQIKLATLAQETQMATVAVRDLERISSDAKAYLSGAIPDDLRRLLSERRARPVGPGNRERSAPGEPDKPLQ